MSASWTPEEDRLLRSMAAAGESTAGIGMLTQAHCVVSSQSGSLTQDQNDPFAARAEGAEKSTVAFLMAVQHRGTKWTPEENRRLLDLIKAGKSWVFFSANLKRPVKSIRIRLKLLKSKAK